MSLSRVTIYITPDPELIIDVTGILGRAGVNGVAMTVQMQTAGDAIRFLVDQPNVALTALQDAKHLAHLDQVEAVEIDDSPGALSRLLQAIKAAGGQYDALQVFPSGKDLYKAIVVMVSKGNALAGVLAQLDYRSVASTDLT